MAQYLKRRQVQLARLSNIKQHPASMKKYRMTAAGAPEKGQSMIIDFVCCTEPFSEKKTQALNTKVAAMVVLDLKPYSVAEDHGFKELIAEAVTNYCLSSCTKLSHTLVLSL